MPSEPQVKTVSLQLTSVKELRPKEISTQR